MNNLSKIFILLLTFLVSAKYVCAQTPEPVFLASDRGMQKSEIVKLQMRDDLKLSPAKFDSVMVIQNNFKIEQRSLAKNKTLLPDERNKKMKANNDKREKALKALGLDDAEIKRVETYFSNK